MGQIVKKETMSKFLEKPNTQNYLQSVLGSKKERFVTNLASIASQDKALSECTNTSVMSGAIVATTLNLSLNKAFGYAYLIPFKVNEYNKQTREREHIRTDAQFQIGYKGYVQLAMRTGEYRKLNAIPIYENQFISWNEMEEVLTMKAVDGVGNVVGYVSFFELLNGFKKTMYWTYDKMLKHANEYSSAFDAHQYKLLQEGKIPKKDMWKYSSFWYKSFNDMALKTMYRVMLSKFGPLSEEMQKAYEYDQSVVVDNKPVYIDNMEKPTEPIVTQPDPMADENTIEAVVEDAKDTKKVNIDDV